jgi:prepilin-type N-terminal cleavage/methylation domain-containing protein
MINKPKGFTLIETMVAVFLLATAIAGPITIAAKAVISTTVARNQIVAFFLAQDGVEYVRYKRDSNKLAKVGWTTGLGSCTSTTGATLCTVDSVTDTVAACTSNICSNLYYDATAGSYGYDVSKAPTIFKRTVSIKNDPSGTTPYEALVTVTVSWSDVAGVVHAPAVVREYIYDWQ